MEQRMKNIKIFITHTPNKENRLIELPIIQNIIAGADYQIDSVPDHMLLDNTGDHISSKNKSYCELTTQYWAWKNQECDYYGFCHYRRLFSFNEEKLKEDGWGTVPLSYLNEKSLQKLKFDEENIKKTVEPYDFIIANGINVKLLKARTVADHYRKAKDLNYNDFQTMMDIIKENYPFLYEHAKKYADGDVFYPCNMFIMKKELFHQYSELLFGILGEFEKRWGMSEYSVQSMRTIGHLGERIAGIYYTYIKSLGEFETKELQIALFKNTQNQAMVKADEDTKNVPVVLAANNFYVPYLSVCIQSIVESTRSCLCNIYVLHTDISCENQKLLYHQIESKVNIKLKFIQIGEYICDYKLQAKDHITAETFYRFLILDIMKEYEKVIYLDCDLIVCRDLSDLYKVNLENNLIGAVKDVDFAGQLNSPWLRMKEYEEKTLHLKDPYKYFQAGVLLMNITEMRKAFTTEKLLEMAATGIYKYSDQDILNIVCEGRVTYINMSWNVINDCDGRRIAEVASRAPAVLFEQYMESRKSPCIIHYAGIQKPWKKASEDFAWAFWNISRRTPYYEQILERLCKSPDGKKKSGPFTNSSFFGGIGYYLFPIGTRRRELIKKIYYSIIE
jgi:lipopolysaccharide biosynthesis glycosyltransferase